MNTWHKVTCLIALLAKLYSYKQELQASVGSVPLHTEIQICN